jgi:hypothetical protein
MTENPAFSHYLFPGISKLYSVIYAKNGAHYYLLGSKKRKFVEKDRGIGKWLPQREEVTLGYQLPVT